MVIPDVLRQMVQNTMKWCRANNLSRTNAVHGAEEFRVKTFEGFVHQDIDRHTQRATGEALMEVHLFVIAFMENYKCI